MGSTRRRCDVKAARCPTCKKEVAPAAKTFPFCSERCRLVDLGNWLGGTYRIAGEPTSAEGDGREADDEEGEAPRKH